MSHRTTDVTVLGTGLMGAAIARTLLRAGRSVTVWNRSPERARDLAGDGAHVVDDASSALHASDVTLVVVLGYDTVRELLERALRDGPIGRVVNLVTGTPAQARELATWAREHDVALIDGAILTYPRRIGSPAAIIPYAGDRSVWERDEELLRVIAGSSEYLGEDAALANTVDHTVLDFVTAAQTALFEALAYAQRAGLPLDVAARFVGTAIPTVGSYLTYARPMLESGDFATHEAAIDTWVRSSRSIASSVRESGLPGRMITAAAESIAAAQDRGHGRDDLAAVFRSELADAG